MQGIKPHSAGEAVWADSGVSGKGFASSVIGVAEWGKAISGDVFESVALGVEVLSFVRGSENAKLGAKQNAKNDIIPIKSVFL